MIELADHPDTAVDAAGLLAEVRSTQRVEWAAQARLLELAAQWADLHPPESIHDTATLSDACSLHGDTGITIAGDGAPLVAQFAVLELAATLGLTPETGTRLVADALELRHRLPRVWARVQALQVPAWRARRVSRETIGLTPEAARFVDAQIATVVHKVGAPTIERLVTTAIADFMPEQAKADAAAAADRRHVGVDVRQVGVDGTCRISGRLDLPDALDLQAALVAGAAALAEAGSEEHLDARRALALGQLARGGLDGLDQHNRGGHDQHRSVTLYVHVSPDSEVATVENTRTLVHHDDLARWLTGANVTIKPVIDLTTHRQTSAYAPTDLMHEQATLLDGTCVFPWCTRPARSCDRDHVIAHGEPGGVTATDNLGSLCRLHHRLKTHGSWIYTVIEPGTYLWHGPHGQTWLRDPTGTREIGPGP